MWRRFHVAGLAATIVCAVASLAAFAVMRHSETRKIADAFNREARHVTEALARASDRELFVLDSMESFYRASTEVTRDEFHDRTGNGVDPLLRHH